MAIVVSHLAPDLDALLAQLRSEPPMADLIELRLDRIGDPGDEGFRALLAACPKAVVVSVRGPEAFGTWEGEPEERLAILRRAARCGASFVDVDWTESLALGEVEGRCHRIVSRHEPETPADLAGLGALHEEVRAVLYEGDIVKLVTHAHRAEDGLRMMRFVHETGGGLTGFCSGEAGTFTRVVAPILGSPFTYAAPARLPGRPAAALAAPGQYAVNDLRAQLPPGGLSHETAIFAVVGNPVRHSFSPRVHGMALKAARLDAVYVALELESFDGFLDLVSPPNWRGFAVTAPFKEAAFAAADASDEAARATRAANTLARTPTGWSAANTDVPAIADVLERAFRLHGQTPGRPVALGAARVVVLGTGGAARAAVCAVKPSGARVTIAGRRPEAARALAAELGVEGVGIGELGAVEWDALVNCTPVGSLAAPGELPLAAGDVRPGTVVLDATYRPVRTPLLALAFERGCTAVPGGEWFVRQALAQFQRLTRHEPDERLLRAAFETALAEAPATAGAAPRSGA